MASDTQKSTGMVIDGIFASEAIDSSGETISVDGMDISDFLDGLGVANYEHLSPGDTTKPGTTPSHGQEIVGKVLYAKKILKESDCENERQVKYWKMCKEIPYLYGMVRLYDGAGHEPAKALAAQIRDHAANGDKILVRYSIEGSTTGRDPDQPTRITSSIARRVALTIKPCNKTADLGLVEDPNAPEGWKKNPEKASKDILEDVTKFEDPAFSKFGSVEYREYESELIVSDHMAKALEAGNMNAAPSSLTGGAALQRQDLGSYKGTLLATIRDYAKKKFDKSEFKAFAKARLPDASDEFIDHFTNVAEDYTAKLKKAEEPEETESNTGLKPLIKKGAHQVSHRGNPLFVSSTNDADLAQFEQKKSGTKHNYSLYRGTNNGKLLKPNDGIKGVVIDEKRGVAHFPFGSMKLYNPDNDLPQHANKFHEILNDPKTSEFHDKAMENWVKVHDLHKQGKTPPEVLMHSVLFSQLSPNTPVPIQELMHAKLVDSMKHTGADARDPGFASKVGEHWLNSGKNGKLPEHSKDSFENNPGVHIGGKKFIDARNAGEGAPKNWKPEKQGNFGEVSGFQLASAKLKNMDKYHQLHQYLADLLQEHKGDARAVATKMMATKSDPNGREIPGLSNKTSRYTMGMIGGGNVVVPDTHFIRHILGMAGGTDSSTLQSGVRNALWDPKNAHELEAVDRWYAKNHPAVKHMLDHPKWGKHFQNAEDAIFPSFWKHWIAIAPHERARGLNQTTATNEGTTHKPFWDAINPYLGKAEEQDVIDPTLPGRTAAIHAQYVEQYGEIPAMMMFYHHLVPKLLKAAKQRESANSPTDFLKSVKLDNLFIALKKSIDDSKPMDNPKIYHVSLSESNHPCGRFAIFNNHVGLLEDYTGLLGQFIQNGPLTDKTIAAIHGMKSSPHMSVVEQEIPIQPNGGSPQIESLLTSRNPLFHDTDTDMPIEEEAQKPDSIFQYKRVGMDKPHIVECINKKYLLDGNEISKDTVAEIMDEVRRGVATIRYHKPETLAKAEGEPDYNNPSSLLTHIRNAVAAGHVHPDVERGLTRMIYEDKMTPGLGNKYAYDEFKAKNKPGVHISMDGNSFKAINDTFGHQVGDQAITAFGKAAREAMNETVGTGQGKLFHNPDENDLYRNGGDEFTAHVPSHEHAARFARALHQKLESIPAIQGVHKLSMAMGFGNDPNSADKALYMAKDQKIHPQTKQRLFKPGQEPNLAHSLVPGSEGPVPLHNDHVEMPPPAPKLETPKA